jgi:hypothetical protein
MLDHVEREDGYDLASIDDLEKARRNLVGLVEVKLMHFKTPERYLGESLIVYIDTDVVVAAFNQGIGNRSEATAEVEHNPGLRADPLD